MLCLRRVSSILMCALSNFT